MVLLFKAVNILMIVSKLYFRRRIPTYPASMGYMACSEELGKEAVRGILILQSCMFEV